MLPATVTVGAIMSEGTSVVGNFGTLIALVAGLGFGLWGVRFLIKKLRAAR